ncbi:MAG: hypothetical protein MO852_15835, partial [Candidatus Devosia euplotis]|nr:hypothetical protein [Candidatus Devosia euplotis]
ILTTFISVLGGFSTPAFAAETSPDRAVFAFGGRHVDAYIEHALVPFVANYEDNFVLSGGYQQFLPSRCPNFVLASSWVLPCAETVSSAAKSGVAW